MNQSLVLVDLKVVYKFHGHFSLINRILGTSFIHGFITSSTRAYIMRLDVIHEFVTKLFLSKLKVYLTANIHMACNISMW